MKFGQLCPVLTRVFLVVTNLFFVTYSIAAYSEEAPQILPTTEGVKLESDSNLYWLHFNKDASTLWPLFLQFWEKEGIVIKDENPQLGFMQTNWINDPSSHNLKERASSVILSDQAPEFKERFRLRIERLPNNMGSRVFIHHSSYGILFDEEAVYTGYLPARPELEIEMLSRLAVFSGANKTQVKKFTSTYVPVNLQAKAIENNQFEIIMPGSLNFVSKKTTEALDRLNIDIKTQSDGTIIAVSTDPTKLVDKNVAKEEKEWGIADSSDLEEEGFDYNPESKSTAPMSDVYAISLIKEKSVTAIHIRYHDVSNINKDKFTKLKTFSQALARNLNR
jgi:uncharacterized lipoprotein